MNKLHTNWKEYSFKDFCDITSSKRIFYREYVKSGVPFYRSKEIIAKSSGKELNDCLYISKDRFEEIKNKYGIPINGDILITAVGTYGIPYLINEDGDFYFKDGNLIWLKNIKNTANNKFLFYWLKSEEAKNNIEKIIIGSVQKALTIDAMKNIKIKLPPLAEQKRIASILSSLDDKIELNNKTNRILEELAQTIFEEWFINFNFPNEYGKPYKKSGGEMIGSELGKIPKGWKIDIISNIFNVTIGKTPPRKEIECFSKNCKDTKWVSISDMGNSGLFIVDTSEYLTTEAIKKYNVNVVPKNTVILSFKLTIGRVSITSEDMTTNEAIAHFNSDNNFINEYLYFYLKNFNYRVLGNTSSIAEAINSKIIKSIKIITPKEDILNKYHNIVFDMFNKIRNNQIENEKLSGIRDSLLPKLMDGEIRV